MSTVSVFMKGTKKLKFLLLCHYSSSHQIACFKVTERLHTHTYIYTCRAALTHQYSVASFATLRVLSSAVSITTLYDFYVTLKHAIWLRRAECDTLIRRTQTHPLAMH
jgi:hypothetical protein